MRGRGWILLVVLALVLILPALILPNPFNTDGPVHVRWQAAFAQAVRHGQFYPRWLPSMNEGFGSPAFFYYPPVLQWVGALFWPIFPGDAGAIRRLALALAALSLVGALGCRMWMRALGVGKASAMLAAAFWLAMPYRAFVDTYQRGALAEVASLALLPWAGLFAVRLVDGRRASWGGHALAIALLAYAHLPGMVIGYLFVFCHALALVLAQGDARMRWRSMLGLSSSALLGLWIAAGMLVPALGLLDHIVDPAAMSGERNRPHNWLLFSHRPWVDPVAWTMTVGLIVMTLMMAAALIRAAFADPSRRRRAVAIAMTFVLVLVALFNTEMAHGFWDLPTPLARIQFPFRLLGASSLAACVLAGLSYERLRQGGKGGLLWLLLLGMIGGDMAIFAYQRLRPRHNVPQAIEQIMASSRDSSEYVLGNPAPLARLFGSRVAMPWPVARKDAAAPSLMISRAVIGHRSVTVDYRSGQSMTLALRQFAFTGWQCRVDGGAWLPARTSSLDIPPSLSGMPAALVPLCLAPVGGHRLEARMPPSTAEQAGGWLALSGLVVALASMALGLIRRRDPDPADVSRSE